MCSRVSCEERGGYLRGVECAFVILAVPSRNQRLIAFCVTGFVNYECLLKPRMSPTDATHEPQRLLGFVRKVPARRCLKTIRIPEEHLDRALGRYFWFAKAEMYPQKYPSIPPVGYAIENGDF